MRVVTVFEEHHPLVRALAGAGCPVTRLGLAELPQSGGEPYFYLGDMFEQIKAPLALARLRRALTRDGAPYVMWNRDAPWNCAIKPWRKLLVRASRRVDLHLAHSLQSTELFGESVVYFPNAAESDRYNLGGRTLDSLRDPGGYQFDVSFVGTLSPGFRMVRARVAFLAELGRRLERSGVNYRFFDTSLGSSLSLQEQVAIIQTSRINLSVGAVCDKPATSWGLPERCFGIASCGGFLLCDERRHAADTFPEEARAEFRNLEECVERIRYFIAHFDLSRARAECLHRDVMERHTYAVRARQLLDLVAAWKRNGSPPRAGTMAA
jgi:spore maturation protein CgeB